MKRILSLILTAITLFSLASCSLSDKIAFSDEQYEKKASQLYEKESKKAAKIEKKKNDSVDKTEDEIGKTIKGEKLVTKQVLTTCTIYDVIYFKKNGDVDYTKTFKYYNDISAYNMAYSVGDDGNNKLIKHNEDIMLIVYQNKKASMYDFDELYKIREKSKNHEIIE